MRSPPDRVVCDGRRPGPSLPGFLQRPQTGRRVSAPGSRFVPEPSVRRDADDLASAASWVATEIVESAADISRELARHDESSMQMAQEARLELQLIPSSFLLSSAIVAVPALIEAHAAAEAELQMPGPKVFLCNAAVLVTTALTVVVWLCLATLRLPPPSSDGEVPVVFINYYQTMLEWLQSVP
eukprot:237817-Prymnesium_polylepis.1